MKSKRKIYIIVGVVLAMLLLVWLFFRPKSDSSVQIKATVKKGNFVISVTTTGDLEAKKSEKINGPSPTGMREARLWQFTIDDIIPDGTVVDSGNYVARLDRSELTGKIKDKEIEIETKQNDFIKTQLDTTLTLRTSRNELVNLHYNMEEAQITVDQSIYEPPATQRQAQISLESAQRSYNQAIRNYAVKLEQAIANMNEVSTALRKKESEYQKLVELNNEFTIYAPKAGMVIYERDYDGSKRGTGAQVSTWENVVATLPDLRSMITKTYVNEIDISKLSVGQRVEIGVDAFPDKKYSGKVIEVANIGEQMRNSNTKVFEVKIEVNEYDSILRPAMTTKNVIITDEITDVLYIPLEAMHGNDSIQYVFKNGVRQQVVPGKSNENEIIIRAGLKEGDEVLLSPPDNFENYRIVYLPDDVMASFLEEERLKKEEADKKALQMQQRDKKSPRGNFPPGGRPPVGGGNPPVGGKP
jgi:hypothetical protein